MFEEIQDSSTVDIDAIFDNFLDTFSADNQKNVSTVSDTKESSCKKNQSCADCPKAGECFPSISNLEKSLERRLSSIERWLFLTEVHDWISEDVPKCQHPLTRINDVVEDLMQETLSDALVDPVTQSYVNVPCSPGFQAGTCSDVLSPLSDLSDASGVPDSPLSVASPILSFRSFSTSRSSLDIQSITIAAENPSGSFPGQTSPVNQVQPSPSSVVASTANLPYSFSSPSGVSMSLATFPLFPQNTQSPSVTEPSAPSTTDFSFQRYNRSPYSAPSVMPPSASVLPNPVRPASFSVVPSIDPKLASLLYRYPPLPPHQLLPPGVLGPSMADLFASQKPKVRRPQNCFLLFSNEYRKKLKEKYPNLTNIQLSKLLGDFWNALPLEKKRKYEDEADRMRQEFNALNPGYVYSRTERQLKR